jgi:hypothetical protein
MTFDNYNEALQYLVNKGYDNDIAADMIIQHGLFIYQVPNGL